MTHPGVHPLHGSWLPLRAELDGEAAPSLALERMELVLGAGSYAVSFAGEVRDRGALAHDDATLTLLASHGGHAGRVIPAIYQLAGDRLRICYALDGGTPSAFATAPGSQRYLVTYRRLTSSS